MDSNAIKNILEKYWEGESSLKEEQALRQFFNQEEVPDDLKQFQPLFQYFEQEQTAILNGDFDERLSERLQQESTPTTKVRSLNTYIKRIAAIAAIMIGVVFFFNYWNTWQENKVFAEHEKQEAKAAYEDAKTALLLLSKKLNKGTSKAEKGVRKVQKTTKVLR